MIYIGILVTFLGFVLAVASVAIASGVGGDSGLSCSGWP